MKHYILVKFKKEVILDDILDDIKNLFNEALTIEGIHSITYKTNVVNRDNRYHLMIVFDMDNDALALYDESKQHLKWKQDYASMIESKAIIDCED